MDRENLANLMKRKAEEYGSKMALCQHGSDGESYTFQDLDRASSRMADRFVSLGVQIGDRVALLCDSRPRWGVAFFATLRAGAIVLPLDTRQAAAELGAILTNARPKLLLVSSGLETTARQLAEKHRDIGIFSIEPESCAGRYPSIDAVSADCESTCVERDNKDPAVLTYTSGTMGESKGVVTSYGNLLFQIRAFREVMANDAHCSAVSILPLSHLFELTAGFLGLLYGGGKVCYCNSLMPEEIKAAMREQRVTCMVTVPLFLKLVAGGIRREIGKLPSYRRAICRVLLGISPHLPLAMRRRLFGRIHAEFGGRLEYFVCGGAPLDEATRTFFDAIGIPVYQGYGLAETSPVIATNAPCANRNGSVGRALPGIDVRISEQGEILTRGPHVMSGYFGDEALTRSMVDEQGWLHTGDIGRFDADGYLFITGRAKNAIVLGSGKKVQPEELEEVLFEHRDIAEGCIVGVVSRQGLTQDSEEVCAVAVPSEAAISQFADNRQAMAETIQAVIRHRALSMPPYKRPTRVIVRCEPLPRTSTRKIRRPVVRSWLDQEVSAT